MTKQEAKDITETLNDLKAELQNSAKKTLEVVQMIEMITKAIEISATDE